MPKHVMTFGTFDVLHPGHQKYLEQARAYGDFVTVIVAQDATVERIKGSPPRRSMTERIAHLQAVGWADQVLAGDLDDPYTWIGKLRPEVLCFGYDQSSFNTQALDDYLSQHQIKLTQVRLAPFHPELYKSSKMPLGDTK